MRKLVTKFSDERKKKYCIKTVVAEDEKTGKKYVYKSNVYAEGAEHIQQVFQNADLLKKAYPDVKICPVTLKDNGELEFAFISGKSLESYYRHAIKQNDKAQIEKLLQMHANILVGGTDNMCEFQMSSEFQKIFGLDEWKYKKNALRISNLDGNCGNIIFQEEIPTFIDYEWVFDFAIPAELIVLYNIQDAYKHIRGFEEAYPIKDACKYLDITIPVEEMEKIVASFFSYVYQEEDGTSYALGKVINAKGKKTYKDYDFIEKSWRDASQANFLLSQRVQMLERENERLAQAVEQEKENHRIHAKQIEDAVMEQARQSEVWRVAYETVINSRTWRIAKKFKRLFGRG